MLEGSFDGELSLLLFPVGGFCGLAVVRERWLDAGMVMKSVWCVVMVVVLGACASSSTSSGAAPSSGGEVKVFNTQAEAVQALREGKIKQGDKFAVRE
ncbi:MAG: hypothetical protein EOP84_28700 [Verrucomicrobiaceae bacterium]|nr:MAG: hypothetical protein EOP84_28700 [Verrucomicrobiaceae bacterium]